MIGGHGILPAVYFKSTTGPPGPRKRSKAFSKWKQAGFQRETGVQGFKIVGGHGILPAVYFNPSTGPPGPRNKRKQREALRLTKE